MPRVTVLVNPAAGKGRATALAAAAVTRLRGLGAEVTVVSGGTARETGELAAHAIADGSEALVVVGGDGTLSAILDRLVGSSVPVALVAAGTGNDLARALGLPREGSDAAERAAELALTGTVSAIDVGVAECPDGSAKFLTVAALGFDARVADRTNQLRWPRGAARYYLALVIELLRLRPMVFSIGVDGGALEPRPGTLVAVGNTRSYGGGMPICPHADAADGRFDVTHVGPLSRLKMVRLFPLLLRAGHLSRPEVSSMRAARLEISAPGLVVYADGERVGTESVRFSVLPGALRVCTPGGAA